MFAMSVPGHDRDATFARFTAALANPRSERTVGLPDPDEYTPTPSDERVALVASLG